MKLDLILCTKDRRIHILKLLENINQLNGLDDVYVTVVDASSIPLKIDATLFPNIHNLAVSHTQPGLPSQRNFGLERTSQEIVVFLDDDVILEKNFFLVTLAEFERDEQLSGLGYRLKDLEFNQSQGFLRRVFRVKISDFGQLTKSGRNYWYPDQDSQFSESPMWFPGCAMSYRRSLIRGIRFNEVLENGVLGGYALGEDVEFSLKVMNAKLKGKICTSTVVEHYEAPGERDQRLQMAIAQGDWLRFLCNNFPKNVSFSCVSLRLALEFLYYSASAIRKPASRKLLKCSALRLKTFLFSSGLRN